MLDEQGRLVVSYSALAAFKTCPKSYEIEYEWMRESNHENQAIRRGSAFHKYMENAAKNNYQVNGLEPLSYEEDPERQMLEIAGDYLSLRGLPAGIIHTEESFYHEVIPGVIFRITPDMVYRKDGTTLICRDWKTFGKSPTVDIHISDQARFYIVILEALNPGMNVEFEFEYIRSERINVRRGPRSLPWTAADSYFTVPYTLSPFQKESTLRDLKDGLREISDMREEGKRFYRNGRYGFGQGSCTGCLQRPLCAEEWEHGFVSQDRLASLSKERENLVRVSNESV